MDPKRKGPPPGATAYETKAVALVGDVAEQLSELGKEGWEPWGVLPMSAFESATYKPQGTIFGIRRPKFEVEVSNVANDERIPRWEIEVVVVFGVFTEQLNEAGEDGWAPWGVLPPIPGAPKGTLVGMKRQRSALETRRTLHDGVLSIHREKL